jgi:hypothetical protein
MICSINDCIVTETNRGKNDPQTTYARIEEGNSTFTLQSKTADLTRLTLKRPLKINMELTGRVFGGGKDTRQVLNVVVFEFEKLKIED